MNERDGYLARARAVLRGDGAGPEPESAQDISAAAESAVGGAGASAIPSDAGDERNERYEKSPDDEGSVGGAAARVIARWRAMLSAGLRQWDDARLMALAGWHLVMAFDRGGAKNFRRYLPRSLAALTDDELGQVVNWPALATLERTLWEQDPDTARYVTRGANQLAGWWNERRKAAS